MFSKKILGLVGLLFIGSQVSADSIPKCEETISSKTTCESINSGSYCFDQSGSKIYYYENDCKLVADGAFVVDSDDGSIVDTITAGNSFRMHYCNGSSCVATKGYVKNGDNYFLIKEDGTVEKIEELKPVESATACTGNVGKLIKVETEKEGGGKVTEVSLCLTQNKSVKLDGEVGVSYLAFNLGDLELDANKDDNTKVVITKKPNVLLVNKLYSTSDGEPECYDSTNASIMPRIDNFCEGADCAKYYNCNKGVCTLQNDVCPRDGVKTDDPNKDVEEITTCNPITSADCKEGYYLYSEGLKVKDKEVGTLYHCEKEVATGAKKRTETGSIKCIDVKQIPTGYFKNTAYDSAAATEDRENHNAQYIECNDGTCKAIAVAEGAEGSCSKDGLVYLDESDNTIRLCLDKEGIVNGENSPISIILNGDGAVEGDYFIKVSSDSGNIFGDNDNYTIVTVESGNVVKYSFNFNAESEDNKLFRYAGDNYKVLRKGGSKSRRSGDSVDVSVCGNVKDLYEFKIICSEEEGHTNEGTGYYEHDNTNRNTNYRNRN